ncbi:MAG: hypothetical protein OXH64_02885, partial [Rhodospirillaceae bacterium]|nr:hypothetical protein [Rhodospirillaceae bacterium]
PGRQYWIVGSDERAAFAVFVGFSPLSEGNPTHHSQRHESQFLRSAGGGDRDRACGTAETVCV